MTHDGKTQITEQTLTEEAKARLVIQSIENEMQHCSSSAFGRARWAGLLDAKRTVEAMFEVSS